MELLAVHIQGASVNFTLVIVYRPGSLAGTSAFMEDFADLIDRVAVQAAPIVIGGDVNIHLDDPSSTSTKAFTEIVCGAGLSQLVNEPTHQAGYTLDVVIARTGTVASVTVDPRRFPTIRS